MIVKFSRNEELTFNKGYRVLMDGTVIGVLGKPLSLFNMPSGYKAFTIRDTNGKTINIAVHRFIAYTKYGDKIYEPDTVVRHFDGNHLNIDFDNILIGTQSDNMFDKPKEDRSNQVKNRDNTKYTIEEIQKFKSCYDYGYTLQQIIDMFNISSKGKLRGLFKKLTNTEV